MKTMCKICHRQDEYVLNDGLCILHCSKSSWKSEGKWNAKYVAKFWAVLRNTIMTDKEKHNFTFMIFPPMQRTKTKDGFALSDQSFWRVGGKIAFSKDVDFSFSRFEEPLSFNHIKFKNLKMNNVIAPSVLFNECQIDEAHLNKLKTKTLHIHHSKIEKMSLEETQTQKFHISKSQLATCDFNMAQSSVLSFDHTKIEQLRMYRTQIENIQFKQSSAHRIDIYGSSYNNILMNALKTDTLKFENSMANHINLQNSIIQDYHLSQSHIKFKISIRNVQLNTLHLLQNKFAPKSALQFEKLSLNNLTMHDNEKITFFKLQDTSISTYISMKNTDLKTCELTDVDMQHACFSVEDTQIQHPLFENVRFNSFTEHNLTYDIDSLTMLEKLFKQAQEKIAYKEIEKLKQLYKEQALKLEEAQKIQEIKPSSKKEKSLKLLKSIKQRAYDLSQIALNLPPMITRGQHAV